MGKAEGHRPLPLFHSSRSLNRDEHHESDIEVCNVISHLIGHVTKEVNHFNSSRHDPVVTTSRIATDQVGGSNMLTNNVVVQERVQ